jgi:hypothetical protein
MNYLSKFHFHRVKFQPSLNSSKDLIRLWTELLLRKNVAVWLMFWKRQILPFSSPIKSVNVAVSKITWFKLSLLAHMIFSLINNQQLNDMLFRIEIATLGNRDIICEVEHCKRVEWETKFERSTISITL